VEYATAVRMPRNRGLSRASVTRSVDIHPIVRTGHADVSREERHEARSLAAQPPEGVRRLRRPPNG